jgi:hypothetical protein
MHRAHSVTLGSRHTVYRHSHFAPQILQTWGWDQFSPSLVRSRLMIVA